MKFEEHDTFRAFATIQSKRNYVFFCTPNIDAKLKTSKNTKNSSSEKKTVYTRVIKISNN